MNRPSSQCLESLIRTLRSNHSSASPNYPKETNCLHSLLFEAVSSQVNNEKEYEEQSLDVYKQLRDLVIFIVAVELYSRKSRNTYFCPTSLLPQKPRILDNKHPSKSTSKQRWVSQKSAIHFTSLGNSKTDQQRVRKLVRNSTKLCSANANENNDNPTSLPHSEKQYIDERNSYCSKQQDNSTECLSAPESLGQTIGPSTFAQRKRRISYNTNPLSSSSPGGKISRKLEAFGDFNVDSRINNTKRRFENQSGSETSQKFFCIKEFWESEKRNKNSSESLYIPRRPLKRLLRRSKSVYSCFQDASLERANRSSLVNSIGQSYKQRATVTDWVTSFSKSEKCTDIRAGRYERISTAGEDLKTPPRVSSAPACIPICNKRGRHTICETIRDFNSNANAATSCTNLPSSLKTIFDHNPTTPSHFSHQESFKLEEFRVKPPKLTSHKTYSSKTNFTNGSFCRKNATLASITGNLSQIGEKNTVVLSGLSNSVKTDPSAQKKRNSAKQDRHTTLRSPTFWPQRSTYKRGQFNHSSIQDKELVDNNCSRLDQDIAASVRCLCRISSSEDSCKVCESPSCIPSFRNRFRVKTESDCRLLTGRTFSDSHDLVQKHEATLSTSRQKSLFGDSKYLLNFCQNSQQSSVNNHHSSEDLLPPREILHRHREDIDLIFATVRSSQTNSALLFRKLLHAANAASPKLSTLGIITPEQTEMGCFHSVSNKSKVGPCRTNIFSDVQATIDQCPTDIEEISPIVLRYRTPYFRAKAQVIMPPIRRKETWTVGWIQACDYMKFINQYGTLGCSSWEIPALKSGKIPAVSDSDGVSYPWYGNTTEIATIVGPTDTYRRMNLMMNDNFYPSVTWDIPVSEGTNAHLTRIVRDQSFITWLAAINETTKDIIVLKTVRWNFYLEIDIDPTRELGQRARIVAPRIQKQPIITNGPGEKNYFNSPLRNRRRVVPATDNNSNSTFVGQIPFSALIRPSANNAQTLIWRPSEGRPVIVVPAKEEHRDSTELVLFNGCSAMHGKESIIKEISKQEVIQIQQLVRQRLESQGCASSSSSCSSYSSIHDE
ncbi:uncharacterized protein LOC143468848 [Clavelina lepadiformis]|uniref:uncharacterized protein LOC143468848 n=1 Tax=Clavelina lepadiformis TaxID=159417 RepID=UPI0040410A38